MDASTTSLRRWIPAIVLAISAFGAGCSVREDAAPRDIPADQVAVFANTATGDAATGSNRIYLLTPPDGDERRQLRAVARQDSGSSEALMNSLLSGPNSDEVDALLGTAIPPDLVLNSARTVGRVITIDINNGLDELNDAGLRLALAQLVATATDLSGVERVVIRVDGATREWPTGDGRLIDDALSIYDYPGVLESSQPAFPSLPST